MINKQVQGFSEFFAPQSQWQNYRFDLLSIIVLHFVHPNSDGSFDITDSDVPVDLVTLAHSYGVKVTFSVQPTSSSITDALLTNAKSNFLANVLGFIQRNNLDGIDIDIENMEITNSITGQPNINLMNSFVQDLRNKLSNYLISIDVDGFYNYSDQIFDLKTIQSYASYIMLMGYDYHYSSGSPIYPNTAGSVSPINAYPPYNTTPGASISDSLAHWIKIGVQPEKILLGVPWYGYEWPTVDGNIESQFTASSPDFGIQTMINNAMKYGRIWDPTWLTPWYKYQDSTGGWHEGDYDDLQSLGIKYDLVNTNNFAGIGIWELSYGYNIAELWNLIQNKFSSTMSATLSTNPSIINVGQQVRITLNVVGGISPYSYKW